MRRQTPINDSYLKMLRTQQTEELDFDRIL